MCVCADIFLLEWLSFYFALSITFILAVKIPWFDCPEKPFFHYIQLNYNKIIQIMLIIPSSVHKSIKIPKLAIIFL